MSIHMMRNILGKFNRQPSVLLAMFSKSNIEQTLSVLDTLDLDIRIASNQYNIYLFPTNLIITDDANDQIMSTAYKLHVPVIMVSENNIESNNNNLYICNIKNLAQVINSLVYKRFILK